MCNDNLHNDKNPNYYEILGKSLFNSEKKAVVFINKDGTIIKINEAFEKATGKSASELLGQKIADIVENTRLDVVLKTGIEELHQLQYCFGKTILSDRFPIFTETNECEGAVGVSVFNDNLEIENILTLFEEQQNKIKQYENELKSYQRGRFTFSDIIGSSNALEKVKNEALKAALADIDVLIQGETGTGKELFTHSLFNASNRRQGPLITINCSAIAPSLVESELFGYEAGTFTGANRTGRKGKFELADKGVLFLDEIGDMPLELQPKILRVLESREITRVGGSKSIPIDIMVIAATNRNLMEMMNQGLFREDLFYRLSTFTLTIPPLRQRKEDIPILLNYFINTLCKTLKKPVKSYSANSINCLIEHNWPGNIRELYNLTKKAIINLENTDTELRFDNLIYKRDNKHEEISNKEMDIDLDLSFDNTGISSNKISFIERNLIVDTLSKTQGNKSKAAEILGLNRNTFYRKMKKYNIQ